MSGIGSNKRLTDSCSLMFSVVVGSVHKLVIVAGDLRLLDRLGQTKELANQVEPRPGPRGTHPMQRWLHFCDC